MVVQTRRKPAQRLGELVGRVIDPVTARRGFATADMIAAWPDIAGPRFADCTRPERIAWPPRDRDLPGVLTLRVDGPAAILIQHELDLIIERINVFMGYRAVGRIKLVQAPVGAATPEAAETHPSLDENGEHTLETTLRDVDDPSLRNALEKLGRGILSGPG